MTRRDPAAAAPPPWTETLRYGLLWGAAAVFVALIGMVEVFAGRHVVEGGVSLGLGLPLLAAMAAGYQSARRSGGESLGAALLRAVAAGALVAMAVVVLILAGFAWDLRRMFVNASPALFQLLTFGRGASGLPLLTLAGVMAGGFGGVAQLLRPDIRRPILTGLAAVVVIGLFQELVQGMLPEGDVGDAVRGALFGLDALSPAGAGLVFLLGAGASALWQRRGTPASVQDGITSATRARYRQRLAFVAGALLLIALPQVAGPFLSHVLVLVGLYVLMGLGLNLEVGFAGLLDLGFVAFFAIGAYTVGLLTAASPLAIGNLSFWTAVPIAVAISLLAGIVLGLPVLRIRGDYLAIATLGFGEIIRLLVLSDFLRPWLGGSQGVLGIPKPVILGFELRGPEHLFYLTLAASALVAFVAARLRDSRLGRAWMALREDEDVAEAMGINLVNVKLLAYGLGAAFAGVSGAIFAVLVSSVFPHSFQLLISINVLALIIVGGMGSTPGVVVGAFVLVGLPELLREFSDFRFLVYGAALVIMMQLRPEGLWPAAAIKRELRAPEELSPARPDL